ncbi:MAG: hypothetical protein Q9167_000525 [Letrouitia subvulpina]
MVFKPFSHLARQSLGKTFTHGYAQSVVAATQSSYASSTTPLGTLGNHAANRFSKHGTTQGPITFQPPSASPNLHVKNNRISGDDSTGNDGGLAAYYEAWRRQQQHGTDSKEWKQFEFAKRIGWNPPSVLPDSRAKEKEDLVPRADVVHERGVIERAYSADAVEDIKKAEDVVAEASAIAEVNEAIAKEINNHQPSPQNPTSFESVRLGGVGQQSEQETLSPTAENKNGLSSPDSFQSSTTVHLSPFSPASTSTTAISPSQDTESQLLSEHISKLSDARRFDEVPPVFESMLVSGLQPTVKAYNALLAAAINLPAARHQVVPKALHIYTDMLRRKVFPDLAFYSSFIQLLSQRAIDVYQMKRDLDARRMRCGGQRGQEFLFQSDRAEYDILAEDDAVNTALMVFAASTIPTKKIVYSSQTYRLLITACALHLRVEDMIRAYSHMEAHNIIPDASMFPPMIEAFAVSGDLGSAVECYNEYKSLAIADDRGQQAVTDRQDNDVYAAVVKAYAICGKLDGAKRFQSKILESYQNPDKLQRERLQETQEAIISKALVQDQLEKRHFAEALKIAEDESLTPSARSAIMARICSGAADNDSTNLAETAHRSVKADSPEFYNTAVAMLSSHTRQGNVDQAREFWAILMSCSTINSSLTQPAILYVMMLIDNGLVDEALLQARHAFLRIRASVVNTNTHSDVVEEVDEAMEILAATLAEKRVTPSPRAAISFLWAMIENGGLISPASEQMLACLEPRDIADLSWQDFCLILRVESDMISEGAYARNNEQLSQFEYLLDLASRDINSLNPVAVNAVERALSKISTQRSDLSSKWYGYCHTSRTDGHTLALRAVPPPVAETAIYSDSFDPYAETTDFRGSGIISDLLDSPRSRNNECLSEALLRFKNIRRAGRHPRYIVYSKLVTAAARDGKASLVHEIIGMARKDIPFVPQNAIVHHGWATILDSMVGACLTLGDRDAASSYHQELLEIGSAPTANTFGLYITTLKGSTRTFDEATEAVKIFHRAKSEGVEPSSFLYNALIGKLGKARRIDDCLFYFAEMRSLGIRPTSVTYGTIVNALCRVSDERFAEELFDEMESVPNYKPRPAPYNSLMQFFLTTKCDREKVLAYYNRMLARGIQPTMHTYKLLIDTYATLDPIDLNAAEGVLDTIRHSGQRPEAVHYASLIHAKGCALHDLAAARQTFDEVMANPEIRPQPCLYQALFESLVANHVVTETKDVLQHMALKNVEMTPYIANTLIHGWAMDHNITKAKAIYDGLGKEKREPSTYEAMTRAFLSADCREAALEVVQEMLSRGYPPAVSSKITEILNYGGKPAGDIPLHQAAMV